MKSSESGKKGGNTQNNCCYSWKTLQAILGLRLGGEKDLKPKRSRKKVLGEGGILKQDDMCRGAFKQG